MTDNTPIAPTVHFLCGIATLCRLLISTKRATHITKETAYEVDILATLPWPPDTRPADVVKGWLLASLAHPDYPATGGGPFEENLHEIMGARLGSAAERAELAMIATHWLVGHRWPTGFDGTLEGARAAWRHIVDRLDYWLSMHRTERRIQDVGITDKETRPVIVRVDMLRRYRRELEVMK